jgi:Spy/CpxP family protein refolding chaperone
MTVKPRIVALSILLGTLVLPALASARPAQANQGQRGPASGGSGHSGRGLGVLTNVQFLTRYLSLTNDQVTQLQGFLQTLESAEQTVQSSRTALCQQLRTDLNASAPDPATVGTDYLALIASQAKVQAALTAFEASLSAILTSDQLIKFQALIQGAGSGSGIDALPGCPPSTATSS